MAETSLLFVTYHSVGGGPARTVSLPLLPSEHSFFITSVLGLCSAGLRVVLSGGCSKFNCKSWMCLWEKASSGSACSTILTLPLELVFNLV